MINVTNLLTFDFWTGNTAEYMFLVYDSLKQSDGFLYLLGCLLIVDVLTKKED